ncbi:hypothetical protein GGR56DRAFT_530803 [Xylariaceae sp. FL0804]|nr:hypothetical protein GGR56DRAFT_530803 [Xylariaceae sp. FL0804]
MESPRLAPCELLQQKSIPSTVWFEDALAYYGVPTVVFDLHLLVPDITQAAEVLRQEGWLPETPGIFSFLHGSCPLRFCLLARPRADASDRRPRSPHSNRRVDLVLLPAADWAVSMQTLVEASANGFVPPLHTLADSLIAAALDSPDDSELQRHLFLMLAWLYAHVEAVKAAVFVDELDPVHRQFHLDCVSGEMKLWSIAFIKHERRVRDEVRKGHYELRHCSALQTGENKALFDDPFANILMPDYVESNIAADEVEATTVLTASSAPSANTTSNAKLYVFASKYNTSQDVFNNYVKNLDNGAGDLISKPGVPWQGYQSKLTDAQVSDVKAQPWLDYCEVVPPPNFDADYQDNYAVGLTTRQPSYEEDEEPEGCEECRIE